MKLSTNSFSKLAICFLISEVFFTTPLLAASADLVGHWKQEQSGTGTVDTYTIKNNTLKVDRACGHASSYIVHATGSVPIKIEGRQISILESAEFVSRWVGQLWGGECSVRINSGTYSYELLNSKLILKEVETGEALNFERIGPLATFSFRELPYWEKGTFGYSQSGEITYEISVKSPVTLKTQDLKIQKISAELESAFGKTYPLAVDEHLKDRGYFYIKILFPHRGEWTLKVHVVDEESDYYLSSKIYRY